MKKLTVFVKCIGLTLMFVSSYYQFEDNSYDSANENDGIEYGGISYVNGVSGQAAEFDGIDDYIHIPYAAMLHPSTFTLSAWFKTEDSGWGTIITSDPNSGRCNHGYELSVLNGMGRFGVDPSYNCESYPSVTSDNALNDGEWHHIVAMYDSSLTLYVDGIQQYQTDSSTYNATNSFLRIGMTLDTYRTDQRFFNGSIDELRLYDRTLSSSEIQQLYSLAPEPVSSVLFVTGGAVLGFRRFRKNRRKSTLLNQ